jgi:hypothetical protein
MLSAPFHTHYRNGVPVRILRGDMHVRIPGLTKGHNMNYVPPLFWERTMFNAVIYEAAALTSLALFVGMIAIWSQVFSNL